MRLIVQRVSKAKVSVNKKTVGEINKGLLILLGVKEADNVNKAEHLAEKVYKLRVMSDENDKMNLSVEDVGGEFLVVSQFTLHADTSAGNRPSFIKAANPDLAKAIYKKFIERLKSLGANVKTGEFGAYMNINLQLDGPVTIIYDL